MGLGVGLDREWWGLQQTENHSVLQNSASVSSLQSPLAEGECGSLLSRHCQKMLEIWVLMWTLGWWLSVKERNMQTEGDSSVGHIQPMGHWFSISALINGCIAYFETQRWEETCLRSQTVHFRDYTGASSFRCLTVWPPTPFPALISGRFLSVTQYPTNEPHKTYLLLWSLTVLFPLPVMPFSAQVKHQ